MGESSFLRATLEQALKMNLQAYLPKTLMLITAGTPLMKRWFRFALHWDMGCMMSTVAVSSVG